MTSVDKVFTSEAQIQILRMPPQSWIMGAVILCQGWALDMSAEHLLIFYHNTVTCRPSQLVF